MPRTLSKLNPVLFAAALCFNACSAPVQRTAETAAEATPVRNIIFLLADGSGAGLWSVAEVARNDLAVKRMPVVGLVDTRSASHKVTDSAAGASAYATGQRTTNRTISVAATCPLPESDAPPVTPWPEGCEPLETWFEIARDEGKAVGVVTTTEVVDATPAAFTAHSPSRYWGEPIAEQMAEFGLDVLLGGGRQNFAGETRKDGRDLLAEMCERSDCVSNAEELASYRPDDDRPLVGLFAPGDMGTPDTRSIELADMVGAALSKLAQDEDGFVALFESEVTDGTTHANESLEQITAAILEFDRAVGVALDFAEANPGTLVIVTGDHETGGVSLIEADTAVALEYTTGGHTAGLVPLFAAGPQADRFGGLRENYEIGRLLFDIVRSW